jgi:hypothetical protein
MLSPAACLSQQDRAAARAERLGAVVERDDGRPGNPVVGLNFSGPVSDSDLELLQALPGLRKLSLQGAKITDQGLTHLKGLDALEELVLFGTEVTDTGLQHLTPLPRLRSLDLGKTKVSDPGMAHVGGLSELRSGAPAPSTSARTRASRWRAPTRRAGRELATGRERSRADATERDAAGR